jgi:hypothetical protein
MGIDRCMPLNDESTRAMLRRGLETGRSESIARYYALSLFLADWIIISAAVSGVMYPVLIIR